MCEREISGSNASKRQIAAASSSRDAQLHRRHTSGGGMPQRRGRGGARVAQPAGGVADRIGRGCANPLALVSSTRRAAPPPAVATDSVPRIVRPRCRLGSGRGAWAEPADPRGREPKRGGGGHCDGAYFGATEADASPLEAHALGFRVARLGTAALPWNATVSWIGFGDCW